MASIRKRESSGKASYQVRWRVDGVEQTATFPTRAQAVKFRGMVEAAGNQRPPGWSPYTAVAEPVEALTLAEWCAETIGDRSGISERTRTDYLRILDRHLGELGDLAIDEVARNDIGRWINGLAKVLSPKTVANVHGIVSSCLQDAVDAQKITKNNAKGIGLPRDDLGGLLVIYSESDFALIESHMDPHWLPLVDTLKTTGMRWGEATALTPRWMNMMSQPASVKVVQAWRKVPGKGGGWEIGPPKTKRSSRSITITDTLRDQLLSPVASKALDDFVFVTKSGRPVNHAHFYNLVWRPALFAAQSCDTHRKPKWQKGMPIPQPCGCPGTLAVTPRIHDYRHFHASFLIDAGVPLMKISRRLGHESIQTTVNVYGHLMPDADDEILAALGQPSRGPQQSVPAMPAQPG